MIEYVNVLDVTLNRMYFELLKKQNINSRFKISQSTRIIVKQVNEF